MMMHKRSKGSDTEGLDRIFIDLTEVELSKSKRASSVRVLRMNSVEDAKFINKGIAPKTPVIVDGSNCTESKKELVDALLSVYEVHKQNWSIGMFGDTMQKVYTDGKDRLEEVVPKEWTFPVKVMNHRSAKRIVSLANAIRSSVSSASMEAITHALISVWKCLINSHKKL